MRQRLRIVTDDVEPPSALRLELPRLTCVPVGGGKDSIVTIECLRQAGEPLVLFSLGNAAPIEATIAQAGLPAIRVTRRLDPALFALNEAGALNGHVPITGILSLIVVACAIIHGFDAIAMSNEHSASAPNIADVNHQYSKSFEFEQAFSRLLERHVVTGVRYFSLLRPLTEVAIARRFARHAGVFSGIPQLQHRVPSIAGASVEQLVLRLSEMPLRLPGVGAVRGPAAPGRDIRPRHAG